MRLGGDNDRYLPQGQAEGVASHGRVADLLVAEERQSPAGPACYDRRNDPNGQPLRLRGREHGLADQEERCGAHQSRGAVDVRIVGGNGSPCSASSLTTGRARDGNPSR
jgi:hypothetical protein